MQVYFAKKKLFFRIKKKKIKKKFSSSQSKSAMDALDLTTVDGTIRRSRAYQHYQCDHTEVMHPAWYAKEHRFVPWCAQCMEFVPPGYESDEDTDIDLTR